MEKEKIIDGYEKLMHRVSNIRSLIRDGQWERVKVNADGIVKEGKYYLTHLKALIKANKTKKTTKHKLEGIKMKPKRKVRAKSKPKVKPARSKKATKPISDKAKAKIKKRF